MPLIYFLALSTSAAIMSPRYSKPGSKFTCNEHVATPTICPIITELWLCHCCVYLKVFDPESYQMEHCNLNRAFVRVTNHNHAYKDIQFCYINLSMYISLIRLQKP